jgi:hypothetical protein
MEVADKIRKAVPEDLPRIGSALRRAFFDDPLFEWAIQDDDRRQRFLLGFFTQYAKAFLRHDETYTTGGEVVAAALWAPPGAEPVSSKDAEELGRLIEELAGPDASRFLDLTKLFDDHHPHWLGSLRARATTGTPMQWARLCMSPTASGSSPRRTAR